ncbi:hypothetical protein R6242_11035 [Iodobacter sp. CM08]|uniref:hypothetical protein n=1 Tax=Iodobacter sp. CM08 TaxID=3085902 RepID=UPI002980D8BC|nr:hypothetical protein [Iodobacter sp. CM08]MDW5417099.1 hypothetical protein [Iodobacter sp. CM08]
MKLLVIKERQSKEMKVYNNIQESKCNTQPILHWLQTQKSPLAMKLTGFLCAQSKVR